MIIINVSKYNDVHNIKQMSENIMPKNGKLENFRIK